MPARVLLESSHPSLPEGVFVQCDGEVTGQELIRANEDLWKNKYHQFQVWDFSEAQSIAADAPEIHTLARQDWRIDQDNKLVAIAFVGYQPELDRLLDAYEMMSTKWVGRRHYFELGRFETLDKAWAWLEALLKR